MVVELRREIEALVAMEGLLGLAPVATTETPLPDGARSSVDDAGSVVSAGRASAQDRVQLPGYEILSVLDQGGMGIVYKARQVKLNRLVAIKMILAGAHARPDQLHRFRIEAEAIAQLRHPNIVQIYEVGEHAGQPYFSMEFIDGGSLALRLTKTVLPPIQAAELVATLAEAIQAAHKRGIIHRDLKPANVLLGVVGCQLSVVREELTTDNWQLKTVPKITDFGLAKLQGEPGQTQSGAIMGTPSYIAPEQAEGKNKQIGPAVDVYALGAILYETLTGRPPFQGASTLETLEQVRYLEPVPPSRLQPKLPSDLETICLKCLEKDPRKRFDSAQALADDLHRFLAGEPITARPTPTWEKGVKWAKRKPTAAALIAVSVIGIASLLGVWATFTQELKQALKHAEEKEREATTGWALAEKREKDVEREKDLAKKEHDRAEKLLYRCVSAIDQNFQAIQQAKDVSRSVQNPHAILFELARFFAKTSASYREDTELAQVDRDRLAEKYAVRAVDLLERARQTDFFIPAPNRDKLKNEKDLDALRSRPDFQRLLLSVDKKR
jgi:serine/threonine protein kinase